MHVALMFAGQQPRSAEPYTLATHGKCCSDMPPSGNTTSHQHGHVTSCIDNLRHQRIGADRTSMRTRVVALGHNDLYPGL